MWTTALEVLNKLLLLLINTIDAKAQKDAQNERDVAESDPTAFFSGHFRGMSDPTKSSTKDPTH